MDENIKDENIKEERNVADDPRAVLQKLLEQSEENNQLLRKIRSYQNQQRLFGYLKVLIIIVPIILSIIYLPPLLKPIIDQYMQVLDIGKAANSGANINLNQISPDLINSLLQNKK